MTTTTLNMLNKPYKIYTENLEQEALDQFNAAMALPCVLQGALMPDAHTGYSLPIGAVVKTKDQIFPAFVGYDIGCGMGCIGLNINHKEVDLVVLKEYILANIPIGFNSHKAAQALSLSLDGTSDILRRTMRIKGLQQLGTLGGGNHFIEVGYLESTGNIAIVIHSGSRGLGHTVAEYYMKEAASQSAESGWKAEFQALADDFNKRNEQWCNSCKNDTDAKRYEDAFNAHIAKQKAAYMKKQDIEGLHSFHVASNEGISYIQDMNFCLNYAIANRAQMLRVITEGIEAQLGPIVESFDAINRNHNHAEVFNASDEGNFIGDVKHIIHRKGATHAEHGMLGVIPGNMRDGSFIVSGLGNPDSMCSSSHGAGRVLSRKKAYATLNLEDFKAETAKLVTNHTDKMLDESPQAYKDIFEVMRLQSDLVTVVDRVIPLLNIKG